MYFHPLISLSSSGKKGEREGEREREREEDAELMDLPLLCGTAWYWLGCHEVIAKPMPPSQLASQSPPTPTDLAGQNLPLITTYIVPMH